MGDRGVAGITMTEVQHNLMRESPRGKLGWGYVEVIYTKNGSGFTSFQNLSSCSWLSFEYFSYNSL